MAKHWRVVDQDGVTWDMPETKLASKHGVYWKVEGSTSMYVFGSELGAILDHAISRLSINVAEVVPPGKMTCAERLAALTSENVRRLEVLRIEAAACETSNQEVESSCEWIDRAISVVRVP